MSLVDKVIRGFKIQGKKPRSGEWGLWVAHDWIGNRELKRERMILHVFLKHSISEDGWE